MIYPDQMTCVSPLSTCAGTRGIGGISGDVFYSLYKNARAFFVSRFCTRLIETITPNPPEPPFWLTVRRIGSDAGRTVEAAGGEAWSPACAPGPGYRIG